MKRSILAGAAVALALSVSPAAATVTFNYTGGFETYTVPVTGNYILTAYGAKGGNTAAAKGGLGAGVSGRVALVAGDVLNVAVGGAGHDGIPFNGSHPGAGGGGATWIAVNLYTNLLVAGGGGGAGSGAIEKSEGKYVIGNHGFGDDASISSCCFYGIIFGQATGSGGFAGFPFHTGSTTDTPVVGGGGGGGGLFSGGRDGKTGGGQGGGQGNFPGYINAGAAPGGGPSGYGGFGGGGGGDAFGAGGGGAGYMGGIGGDAYHGFRAPWGTGGRGGLTLFMGDEQIGICERCGPGDGLATLTYIVPGSGGGYAGSIAPGVPEPASWAMLIAGFGLVGAAQRRSGRGGPQPAAG